MSAVCRRILAGQPCGGAYDEDGYCENCGKKADPRQDEPALTAAGLVATSATAFSRSVSTSAPVGPSGLVLLPAVEQEDPRTLLIPNPVVPSNKRTCAGCERSLARGPDGTAATEGVCECGRPYSFVPKLKPGDLVAGQYRVEGCLAHGGLGWIYLARDRNLDDSWVVLKGLLTEGDPTATSAAIAERRFLIEVKHPNIVQIRNFVTQDGAGYIVMEYLAGKSLRDLRQRLDDRQVIPVERAVEFILAVLPAFEYLHSIGLLYCDFKPDNVINTLNAVKLIDLGAVYQVGGSTVTFGTVGYQAPEVATDGPSVASDLYTIARTLAVLIADFDRRSSDMVHRLPSQRDVPVFAEHESLYRFLLKGTATDPADRFQSAAEMRAQLALIQHEIVAVQRGHVRVPHSEWFGAEQASATAGVDAAALPTLLERPDDAADPFGAAIRAVQVLLDAGQAAEALELCRTVSVDAPHEWRLTWLRGLAALLVGRNTEALNAFDTVYSEVPGELAPKLALAFTAELDGDLEMAERLYDTVSRTSPNLTSAAFGLARCTRAEGDAARAVQAYERVPRTAQSWPLAQMARADCLVSGVNGSGPSLADLQQAASVAELPDLSPAERAELRCKVLQAALGRSEEGTLFGRRIQDTDLRLGLEAAYRDRARYAHARAERVRFVDAANAVRPRTWL